MEPLEASQYLGYEIVADALDLIAVLLWVALFIWVLVSIAKRIVQIFPLPVSANIDPYGSTPMILMREYAPSACVRRPRLCHGPRRNDHGVDLAVTLAKELFSCALNARQRVARVCVLVEDVGLTRLGGVELIHNLCALPIASTAVRR